MRTTSFKHILILTVQIRQTKTIIGNGTHGDTINGINKVKMVDNCENNNNNIRGSKKKDENNNYYTTE